MDTPLLSLLTSTIGISVIEDLRRHRIPNLVTYPSMVLAIGYHSFSSGLEGLAFSFGGLALGIGLFIVPYLCGAMGAGDAKLIGAAGAILGPKGILISSIIAILAGGVYALIYLLLNPSRFASILSRWRITFKTFTRTAKFIPIPPEENEKRPVLCFAVPAAVGTLFYVTMITTGYDPFPKLMGDGFKLLNL